MILTSIRSCFIIPKPRCVRIFSTWKHSTCIHPLAALSDTQFLHSIIRSTALVTLIKKKFDKHVYFISQLNSNNVQFSTENLAKFSAIHSEYTKFQSLATNYRSITELYNEATQECDSQIQEDCHVEFTILYDEMKRSAEKLIDKVIPSNPQILSNALIEVRVGTGGYEASLFALELVSAYQSCAKEWSYALEVWNQRRDGQGLKEISLYVKNTMKPTHNNNFGPFGHFQYESGVHRVQRVPINDVKMQTSAVSVAVLPFDNTVRNESIPTHDFQIVTMKASGAGGQHVNTTDSAVRVTHLPTGISAAIQTERSQHRNKAKAIQLVTARVINKKKEKEEEKLGKERKSLLGGGDRSERIRTYHFGRDTVIDHRIGHVGVGIRKLFGKSSTKEDLLVGVFQPKLYQHEKEKWVKELDKVESK